MPYTDHMSSGSTILSIGQPADPNAASRALIQLHEQQPVARLLFAQGGQLGGIIAQGGHPLNNLPRSGWGGHWSIRSGERPPCTGIDLVRAVLCEARDMAERPEVIAWGPVPAFWENRRQREWDVPHDVVVAQVLRIGLSGWGWVGDRLVRLSP